MPRMYIQNVSIPVDNATPSDDGTLKAQTTYSFPTNVIAASASVASYTVSYGKNDHNVMVTGVKVSVQTQVDSPTVSIGGWVQLEDDSGNVPKPNNCTLVAAVVAWAE